MGTIMDIKSGSYSVHAAVIHTGVLMNPFCFVLMKALSFMLLIRLQVQD